MKNAIHRKLSALLIMSFMIAMSLTACVPNFDASGYIKACLDASTKAEFDAYAEITHSDTEDIEALYNQSIDTEIAYIENHYHVSEETKEKFRTLFIDIYKSFKYEVGEATRNEDNSYTVPVTTYKLQVFKGYMDGGEEYLTQYAQTQIDAGQTPTQKELEEVALNYMYDKMSANLEAAVYAEPVTTDILVSPTKNGSSVVYSASQSDLQGLIETLVDFENAEQDGG